MATHDLRWHSYVLERDKGFHSFWRQRSAESGTRILVIAGLGFDPRMPRGIEALVACQNEGAVDAWLIDYDEGELSPSRQYVEHVERNRTRATSLITSTGGNVRSCTIAMVEDERKVGGRRVAQLAKAEDLAPYTDVVVDISALPRSLYFPLLGQLLKIHDRTRNQGRHAVPANLHVVICENPQLDARIQEELSERADYLPLFSGQAALTQDQDIPRIWAPVLGEGQGMALQRIEQLIKATGKAPEICPVLPFPATDPRRGDRLLLGYRQLFETWEVELRNIIYAAEWNPFDVYRQLCRLHDRYRDALQPLRGAKMIVSAHSSKLLSLGVLLAAHNREIAVAHVEVDGYVMQNPPQEDENGEMYEIWIAGEPYGA